MRSKLSNAMKESGNAKLYYDCRPRSEVASGPKERDMNDVNTFKTDSKVVVEALKARV